MSAIGDALTATLREVIDDKILSPITRAMLLDPKFKGFDVEVEPWTPRPWDGWFHPSTHSTWTARQLYYYLTDPTRIEVEQMQLASVLAITQGKFFHRFLQLLWLDNGILKKDEVSLQDSAVNCKGHMDGELSAEGVEIKTMNDFTLKKVNCVEVLREKKPDYYSQTQDYLMMSSLPSMRYFIIGTSYPFDMQEFVVPADPEFQAAQREKYRTALEAAERGTPPPVCTGCMPTSKKAKACPVRRACDIGRAGM